MIVMNYDLLLHLTSLSPLLQGAGQDVGRSCILVSIGGKNIMLDCGMHMGYNDDVSYSASRVLDKFET